MRRTVFYIAGFDPRGPVHYHQTYVAESARQTAVNGMTVEVSRRKTIDAMEAMWTVTAGSTSVDYRYLRHEDLVRARWPRPALAVYGGILRYAWHFLRMGVFRMIYRNSWPGFIAVTYPPALLLGAIAGLMLLGLVIALLLKPLAGPLAFVAVPLLPLLLIPLRGYIEKKYNAFWLARSCTFLVDRALGRVQGIEERCAAFAERVAQAVNSGENDEVLLVGHSVGTHLAVTVAARALEQMDGTGRLSLLTLGQAMAMTARETPAARFRHDLERLSASDRIDWIDVTSAIDGSCIALTDPLALSNVTRAPGSRVQPKLVSARFNKAFTPATYATIRRDFLRTHFQYLMATELAVDYDYFLITAGNMTLAERFAHLDSVTDFNRFRSGRT